MKKVKYRKMMKKNGPSEYSAFGTKLAKVFFSNNMKYAPSSPLFMKYAPSQKKNDFPLAILN